MRLAFVVLTLAGGAGVVLYLAGWLWLPEDDGTAAPIGRTRSRRRSDWVQIAALGAVVLGVLLLSQSIGLRVPDAIVWPLVLAAMGTALIVGRSGQPDRRADQRAHPPGAAHRDRRSSASATRPPSAAS